MVLAKSKFMRRTQREGNQRGGDDKVSAGEKESRDPVAGDYIQDDAAENHTDKESGEVAETRGRADEVLGSESILIEALPPVSVEMGEVDCYEHDEDDFEIVEDLPAGIESEAESDKPAIVSYVIDSDYPIGMVNIGESCRDKFSHTLGDHKNGNEADTISETDKEPYSTELVRLVDIILNTVRKRFNDKEIEDFLDYLLANLAALEQTLEKPPLYLINGIRNEIDRLKKMLPHADKRWIILLNALKTNFIEPLRIRVHNDKKIPTGTDYPAIVNGKMVSKTLDQQLADAEDMVLINDSIEVGELAKAGKLKEAEEKNDKICKTDTNYSRLYEEGKHNFMNKTDIPNEVIQFELDEIRYKEKFRRFQSSQNRALELGSGNGNGAVQLIMNFPNLIGYHGLDCYAEGVKTTLERIERLKIEHQGRIKLQQHGVESVDFKKYLREKPEYKLLNGEKLILCTTSALHYWPEPILRRVILPRIHDYVAANDGLLILAMKTPKSVTWFDHNPAYKMEDADKQDGYKCGYHQGERQFRAFVEQDKLVVMLEEAGFDVIAKDDNGNILRDEKGDFMRGDDGHILISKNATVRKIIATGYDFPEQDEEFIVVMAPPKQCKRNH